MADRLRLRVNGRDYAGWTSVQITRGIESIAGGFELTVSDRWAGQAQRWPIHGEDECELRYDGKPIITGYVDGRGLSIGPSEHAFSVSGRDKAAALVDCSAVLDTWEFLGASPLALVQEIAKPFGIKVTMQAGVAEPGAVAKLSIDPGDTAFAAIEKVCRMAALLPVSDGQGGVVLTRAGASRATTALVEGENIRGGSAQYSYAERFHRYRVMAQQQGSDEVSGEAAAGVMAEATDAGVRRKERVLLVRAESGATPEYAAKRAQWEAKVRAGRADPATITVAGWTQRDGTLWPVNAVVQVRSDRLGMRGERLITQATYRLSSDGGTTTELALKRPDAFDPEPEVPKDGTYDELREGA